MKLTELIDLLPRIIFYLAAGFIFLYTFSFFAYKKPLTDNVQGKITISFVIGFVIKQLLSQAASVLSNCIPCLNNWSFLTKHILFLIVSFLLAFALAKLVKTKLFDIILDKLGAGRTVNNNFWYDIIEDGVWIKVVNYSDKYSIFGLYSKIEEFERKPLIELDHYRIENLDGEIVEDYVGKKQNKIILNLEKYDSIHIIYDKDSKHCSNVEVEL